MMRNRALAVVLTLALAAASAHAQRLQLLPAAPQDLVPASLVSAESLSSLPGVSRDTVTFSWALSPDQALDARPAAHVSRSREYWQRVSAGELRRGVELFTTAPGALVRLNPVAEAGWTEQVAIDPMNLTLTAGDGESFTGGAAMELLVTADQLQAADVPFPAGTSAFRLRAELGAGRFVLSAPDLAAGAGQPYLVHVLDANSDLALRLGAERGDYLHGQSLTVAAALEGTGKTAVRRVDGQVISPAGRSWALTFTPDGAGGLRAALPLDALENATGGLWQVETRLEGDADGRTVVRGARTAFAVAVPTARLDGNVERLKQRFGGLALRLGVEVATAGRYEVRGVLYGTDSQGQLRPLGVGDSAAWLEPGSGRVELSFGADVLTSAALRAPFEVRDLQLVDQGRMGVLQRQARALVIARP